MLNDVWQERLGHMLVVILKQSERLAGTAALYFADDFKVCHNEFYGANIQLNFNVMVSF